MKESNNCPSRCPITNPKFQIRTDQPICSDIVLLLSHTVSPPFFVPPPPPYRIGHAERAFVFGPLSLSLSLSLHSDIVAPLLHEVKVREERRKEGKKRVGYDTEAIFRSLLERRRVARSPFLAATAAGGHERKRQCARRALLQSFQRLCGQLDSSPSPRQRFLI